ncbi:MAG: carbohydrate ABC transporter permease [Rhodospirillales bacterium]|nr:carbohydrate ABC transporter permease [Rhodospirillales bacterium]
MMRPGGEQGWRRLPGAVLFWLFGLVWALPLLYAIWSAVHPPLYSTVFALFAPLTWHNFAQAWNSAPFARYFLNTIFLVSFTVAGQVVLATLAAFAFARLSFPGRDLLFALLLVQLMISPAILLVWNYREISWLGLANTIPAMGIPYLGSAFGIFLLRQNFRTIPSELDDAARLEGCSLLGRLWKVYVPLSRSTYIAFALASISYHWNDFLWPLVISDSVSTRPLTVGLEIFATPDQGVQWSLVTAATLMSSAPLLIAFLLFQRQFVQSFLRAGIR